MLFRSDLETIAREIGDLEKRAAQKDQEAEAIQKEEWPDPEAEMSAGGDPQIGAGAGTGTASRPRAATTGTDPQIGAATGPAPHPVTHEAKPGSAAMSAATVYCAACGMVLRPEAAFCPRCGLKQD